MTHQGLAPELDSELDLTLQPNQPESPPPQTPQNLKTPMTPTPMTPHQMTSRVSSRVRFRVRFNPFNKMLESPCYHTPIAMRLKG